MHLLSLSKYLTNALICGRFMYNGDGRVYIYIYIYTYIYIYISNTILYEPFLQYDFLSNKTIPNIYFINT